MSATDPTDPAASAVEIAEAVRTGRVTAREVVDAALARIDELQPRLNCFEQVVAEKARAAADLVEPGDPRPLAGVPVAVKAENDVAGLVTTYGGRSGGAPAREDSEVVRRLRAAGAVVVGTTTMPELGQFPFTEGASWGQTRNPWEVDRTTGGSSGGSAAPVASGCVPVAIGGDGGGSIRIPRRAAGSWGSSPPEAGGPPPRTPPSGARSARSAL